MIRQNLKYFTIASIVLLSSSNTSKPTLEIRNINGYSVPVQNNIPLFSSEEQSRPKISLSGEWQKKRINVNHALSLKDRTKETILLFEKESEGNFPETQNIPSLENIPPDKNQDCIWYRKTFAIPAGCGGKFIRLHFGAANYITDVWINGKWIGYHEGGYTPFSFDITPYIKTGGENTIAVRVDNIPWLPHNLERRQSGALHELYMGKDIVPYKTCDWWNANGIIRPVYIEICGPITIANTFIKSESRGKIDINPIILNYTGTAETSLTIKATIYEAKVSEANILSPDAKSLIDPAKPIALQEKSLNIKSGQKIVPASFTLKIDSPKLWSQESPNIYVAEISLNNGSNIIDAFYTQFGVRDISVKSCRLFLNNKMIYLNGIARHEVINYSMDDLYNDLLMIKETNSNFIRTGHYPNEPEIYLLTDRMGFAVWEEIPVYWFDETGFKKQSERKIADQMWLEMIYRDYNRPSILFWGACNECSTQDERAEFIKRLYNLAYETDGARLVAQSASGNDPLDGTHSFCDIIGVTMYYGIFYGKEYYNGTLKALEAMHAVYPDKPIIATEYGTWSGLDLSLTKTQVKAAEETLKAFFEKPYVTGWVWWCAFDWYSMITTFQTMGAVNIARDYFKPVYYSLQKIYGSKISDLNVEIASPNNYEILRGICEIKNSVKSSSKIEKTTFTINGIDVPAFNYKWNTSEVPDGEYVLYLKSVDSKGVTQTSIKKVFVDNIDDPPEIIINLKDRDWIMHNKILEISLKDDRTPPMDLSASIKTDGKPAELSPAGPAIFTYNWDVNGYPDNSSHTIEIEAEDSFQNRSKISNTVYISNIPGIYITLPYNHDWVSSFSNMSDGTGWDFPSEELPASNTDFIYNYREKPVKFYFGDKADSKNNNLECLSQDIKVPSGKYTHLYILASSHDGSSEGGIMLQYEDNSSETSAINISDWWGAIPMFGEETAIKTSYHHERNNRKNPPGVGIYFVEIKLNPDKKLVSIQLPNEPRLHIFAMTLE